MNDVTGPRVTEADIEANIIYECSFIAKDAAVELADRSKLEEGGHWTDLVGETMGLLTICILILRNGFKVIGTSAAVSPLNFDADLGRRYAREDAIRQVGPLMGYALRDKMLTAAPPAYVGDDYPGGADAETA